MNETDYFEVAKGQLKEHYDQKYGRKLPRDCMICGDRIPWGYIEFQGIVMCDECFENLGLRCKVCK